MKNEIVRGPTPEERELHKKILELSGLEEELTQRELDLATIQFELHNFEASYIRIVGARLAELDEVRAQIAETEARLNPRDNNVQHKASKARAQAQESAQATRANQEVRERKSESSETLKKLYREIAKRIHPDLTTDEKERKLREQLMAEANRAYQEGDEAKLRDILDKWENSPDSIKGEGIPAELVRVIRKIAQVKKRLDVIEKEITGLKESDLSQIKMEAEKAEREGRDLLAEMASRVNKDISLAKKRLTEIGINV